MGSATAEETTTANNRLTVEEVAKRLGVSPFTVHRRLNDGSLPGKMQMWKRGQVYVNKRIFEAYMAQVEGQSAS